MSRSWFWQTIYLADPFSVTDDLQCFFFNFQFAFDTWFWKNVGVFYKFHFKHWFNLIITLNTFISSCSTLFFYFHEWQWTPYVQVTQKCYINTPVYYVVTDAKSQPFGITILSQNNQRSGPCFFSDRFIGSVSCFGREN